MVKDKKRTFLYAAGIIILLIALTHFEMVTSLFGWLWDMALPIVVGLVLAFILDVPVSGFEKLFGKLTAKKKKKPKQKTIHTISIVLTIICVLLVIALLFLLVIPELVRTAKSAVELIKEQWPKWLAIMESYNIDTTMIKEFLAGLDLENTVKNLLDGAGSVIGSIAGAATSTFSVISAAVIGVIIAVYVLSSRDLLKNQAKKVIYAYTDKQKGDRICYVSGLVRTAYSKFLSGQCLESILLGILIFIAFTIFRLPYAGLIGAVTAICALIPYIGALISCGLGVILCLMDSPKKALICLIVYLAVQFIETQFIYPYVVGGSVGLSPLWTLISVLVGGKLLGLMGMIFFIPLVSVIYTLVKEDTDKRLELKKKAGIKTQ